MSDAQYSVLAQMTGNAALALQAFLSDLCAVGYYGDIVKFGTGALLVQTWMERVTRPIDMVLLGVCWCVICSLFSSSWWAFGRRGS
jgi:hypothetical protein